MMSLAHQARQYYLYFNLPLQILAVLFVIFSQVDWMMVVIFYIMIYWAGVQAGNHKLFSHRSWTPRWRWMRYLLVYFSYFGMMGGTISWAALHRWHHAHSDQERDPHSPRHGAWHAYAGWLFNITPFPLTLCRDHLRDRLLIWMDQRCRELPALTILVLAMIDLSAAGALLVAMTLTFHAEMAVNCFLHAKRNHAWSAVNCSWLAIVSGGSTLHANHHDDPAARDFGKKWYEIDPSAWIIRVLQK